MEGLTIDVREAGRRLGRERREKGWVEKVGTKTKRWLGYFHVYVQNGQGEEERKRRKVTLGACSELTKGAAEELLEKHIRKQRSEPTAQVKADRVTHLIDDYIQLKKGDWSEVQLKTVASILGNSVRPAIGDHRIQEVTPEILKLFVNELPNRKWKTCAAAKEFKTGASHSYVRKVILHLRSIFDLAITRDLIMRNPARDLTLKLTVPQRSAKPRKQPVLRTVEDIQKLMAQLKAEDHLIVRISLVCALRPNETFALRYDDLDLDGQHLRVDEALDFRRNFKEPKTDSSDNWVWMPRSLVREFKDWLLFHPGAPQDLLFPNKNGRPRSRHIELNQMLKPAGQRAGLGKVTFQMLRRTYATHGQKYGSVKSVQGQMRHSTPDMTVGTYMQTISAEQKAAVELYDEMLFGRVDPHTRVQ